VARQVVAARVFATQVVEPVDRAGQGDDRRSVTARQRGVDLRDHLGCGKRIAHFDRVEQAGHSGAEEGLSSAVDGAAALEAERLQQCRTAKIRRSNASRDSKDAAYELVGGKASVTPLLRAVLPEPRRAACLAAVIGRLDAITSGWVAGGRMAVVDRSARNCSLVAVASGWIAGGRMALVYGITRNGRLVAVASSRIAGGCMALV